MINRYSFVSDSVDGFIEPGNDAMNLLPDGQQILGDKIGMMERWHGS